MFILQALGSNGSGQLGVGHNQDVSSPQPVRLPDDVQSSNSLGDRGSALRVRRIVAGGNHTVLQLSSGDLLWSGDAAGGACGRLLAAPVLDLAAAAAASSSSEFRHLDLRPLPKDAKVRLVAATWAATVVVVAIVVDMSGEDGGGVDETRMGSTRVYSFGSGDKGELGLGPDVRRAPEPTEIPDFPPAGTHVVHLAACVEHVVAVLSNGEAWGWGNGRKGQLGESVAKPVHRPRRIDGVGFKVVSAVCGREFTCLFGPPETGEMVVLGSDKWGVRTRAPGNVAGWKEVGAGWGSVFVLKEDGTLLSWGRNDRGQLSRGNLGPIRHIAVGSEHALALTEDGDLMAWGWGEHGNCGPICDCAGEEEQPYRGHRNRIASNKLLRNDSRGLGITLIGAGCATSWFAIEPTDLD